MIYSRTGIKRVCAVFLCVCLLFSVSVFASGRNLTGTWENRLDAFYSTAELLDASVEDLSEAMRSGRVTSEEIISMYLRRIESYDRELGINSIITVNPNAAEEARAADEARKSGSEGALLGIPVIIGDSIDVSGLPTSNGSASGLNSTAAEDSEIVRRLRAEGAVIIGKANLSQDTDNEYVTRSSAGGTVHNPFDLSRTPAGSSAGTAVAVACNFAAAGIAVETGASVRMPASYAGIYGMRTSYGLVSRSGAALNDGAEDSVAVLTRFPSDTALILDIIAGEDSADGASSSADSLIPDIGYSMSIGGDDSFDGYRIGYLSNSFGYYVDEEGDYFSYPDEMSPEIRSMTDRAIEVFTSNGAELMDLSGTLTEEYLDRVSGSGGTLYRRVITDILEEYDIDAIVYVASLDVPEYESGADGENYNPAGYQHLLSAHLGLPEIVVPMGLTGSGSGMAVGLNLTGRYGSDAVLLAMADLYSELSDTFTVPGSVPALFDERLDALGVELVSAADRLLQEETLSPGSLDEISAAVESLRNVSMDGRDGTEAVSAGTYRSLVSELGTLIDTAQVLISPAPLKNIKTLRFFIQKYRGVVSVSSLSVLFFVFAMLLIRPGRKKQRQFFSAIPTAGTADAANMSLGDRLRAAAENMREQRRLLKEAREALKSRDITSKDVTGRARGERETGKAPAVSRIEAVAERPAGIAPLAKPGKSGEEKQPTGERKGVFKRLAEAFSKLAERIRQAFVGLISAFKRTEKTPEKPEGTASVSENENATGRQSIAEFLSSRAERIKARKESADNQKKLEAAKRAEERAERRRAQAEKEELERKAREEQKSQRAEAAALRKEQRAEAAAVREAQKAAVAAERKAAEEAERERRAEAAAVKEAQRAAAEAERTAAEEAEKEKKAGAAAVREARAERAQEIKEAAAEEKRRQRAEAAAEKKEQRARALAAKNAQKAEAAAARAALRMEKSEARKQRFASIVSEMRSAVLEGINAVSKYVRSVSETVENSRKARAEARVKKAEEKARIREQISAEETLQRRMRNAEKIENRAKLEAQRAEELARQQQEKREQEERKQRSRERAAEQKALRKELGEKERERRREERASAAAARSAVRREAAEERKKRFAAIIAGLREATVGKLAVFYASLTQKSREIAKEQNARAEERQHVREQKIAEETVQRRIRNAEKVDARNRLLAKKQEKAEEAAKEKARQEQERKEKQERKKVSREKSAALRAEKRTAELAARKEKQAAAAEARKKAISAAKAALLAVVGFIPAQISKAASAVAESVNEKKKIRAAAVREKKIAEAVRAKEKQLENEKKELAAQAVRDKKAAAEAERIQLRERYEQRRIRNEEALQAEKAIQQKEKAEASLQKKHQRAEKKAAAAAAVRAFFDGIKQERELKRSEEAARREQKAIAKAADKQYRLLERNRQKEEREKQKAAAAAVRESHREEQRKLAEERSIEKKAAAVFKKQQREQRSEARRKRISDAVTDFFEGFRKRSEERKVRRAEELFRRNSELRAKKQQLEELKAERDRIAELNRQIEIAEQEKKETQKQARREAEAAYRTMVDRRISEQVEALEAQSEQRRQEQLEIKQRKEEKQREKAAKREALENKRREEKLRQQQERDAAQQSRELAEAERREKEKQLKDEKKAELARIDFEKNKEKIIKAQRKEIQQAERAEKRRNAKQEAEAKRYEKRTLRRKKISIFFRDLPSRIAAVPMKLAAFIESRREKTQKAREEARALKAENTAKRREERALKAEQTREKQLAEQKARTEKKESAAREKAEKKEAAAVAARIKKQEIADRKAQEEKRKVSIKEEKAAKKRASREASAAKAKAFFGSVRKLFAAAAGWVSGVFSTTQNWIKRIFMLISGIVTFVLMIPVRMVKALFGIPAKLKAYLAAQRGKNLAKAENREYKAEQKRIAREKLNVSGQSSIVPVAPQPDTDVPGVRTEGTIRNLEKEAPFTYTQRSLRDILKPARFQMATAFAAAVVQAVSIAAVPELISEMVSSISALELSQIPLRIPVIAASVILACAVSHLTGRAALSSLLRKVSKELRRIEFSIRKDRDSSFSMSAIISQLQDVVEAQYEFIFDISVIVFACIAACISNPFNVAVMLVMLLFAVINRKKLDSRLAACKSVDEAVSVREAVSYDWAKKLRVNKLLGRGNDSYDNVRNAVLDVNIRKLAVDDVYTDLNTALRAFAFAAIALLTVLPFIFPIGTIWICSRYVFTSAALFIVVPLAMRGAADKYAILRRKKEFSGEVSAALSDKPETGES